MTYEIIQCMAQRDHFKSINDMVNYKTYRNRCVSLIRDAKTTYYKHRRTGRGGRGGAGGGAGGGSCPPPKRLQSRKVGQMFNISRAKSGKLKSQKAKKPPVCWANKGSRAIFASQSCNIGLL